jgi:acetyl/propionyl-CoA carboxylase alpha subunit
MASNGGKADTTERRRRVPALSGPGTRSAVKKGVFLDAHRREAGYPIGIYIDMAGGAHGVSTAFSENSVDAAARGRLHYAQPVGNFERVSLSARMHIDNSGHSQDLKQ